MSAFPPLSAFRFGVCFATSAATIQISPRSLFILSSCALEFTLFCFESAHKKRVNNWRGIGEETIKQKGKEVELFVFGELDW